MSALTLGIHKCDTAWIRAAAVIARCKQHSRQGSWHSERRQMLRAFVPSQHWPRHLPLLWHQLTPLKRLLRLPGPGHELPLPRLAPLPPTDAARNGCFCFQHPLCQVLHHAPMVQTRQAHH